MGSTGQWSSRDRLSKECQWLWRDRLSNERQWLWRDRWPSKEGQWLSRVRWPSKEGQWFTRVRLSKEDWRVRLSKEGQRLSSRIIGVFCEDLRLDNACCIVHSGSRTGSRPSPSPPAFALPVST